MYGVVLGVGFMVSVSQPSLSISVWVLFIHQCIRVIQLVSKFLSELIALRVHGRRVQVPLLSPSFLTLMPDNFLKIPMPGPQSQILI